MGENQGGVGQSAQDQVADFALDDEAMKSPKYQGQQRQGQGLTEVAPVQGIVQLIRSIHVGHRRHPSRLLAEKVFDEEVHGHSGEQDVEREGSVPGLGEAEAQQVKELRWIEGQGRKEVEEGVAIAIDQIGCPAGPGSALAQAVIEFHEANQVMPPVVAARHGGFQQGLNSQQSQQTNQE